MKINTQIDFTAENLLKWKEIVFLYSEKLYSTKVCQAFKPKEWENQNVLGTWKFFFSTKMGLQFKTNHLQLKAES